MKDYIFNSIETAERRISDELGKAKRLKAENLDYGKTIKAVLSGMQQKTMPGRWKDQILAILSFCWDREISNNILYPVEYEGALYRKWQNYPEALREKIRAGLDVLDCIKPVFNWDFFEGMPVDYAIDWKSEKRQNIK